MLEISLESSIKWLSYAKKDGKRGFCHEHFLIMFEYKNGKRIKESFYYKGEQISRNELCDELSFALNKWT